jgi:hypothetical protein
MNMRAALADDNHPRLNLLAVISLDAEHLWIAVASVL